MAMEKKHKEELEEKLAEKTVIQLKKAARDEEVDLSGCIRKQEIIDKIIDEGKGDEIAGLLIVRKGSKLTVSEAEKTPEPYAKSKGTTPDVREYLRFMIGNRPSFFEIDGMMEAAIARYATGDHYGAIQGIKSARARASDIYSHFRIFTNALGIDASEKLLQEAVKREGINETKAKRLVEAAMKGFVDGTPKSREDSLEKLESGALEAMDSIVGDVARDIKICRDRASELRDFGADVGTGFQQLSEAERLKTALRIAEAKEAIARVNTILKNAEKVRLEEIRYSIPRVRSAIEEAKSIGISVTDPEKDLTKASYYFERGEMKLCVESLTKAEGTVDQLQHARLNSDPALKHSQLDKARRLAQQMEPILNDITSYGVDVFEAMHYLRNAQTAVARGDAVNAPKFARRIDEVTKELLHEVEKLKKRSVHMEDKRCDKCGQDMLYSYDTGIIRCSNCGQWRQKETEKKQ